MSVSTKQYREQTVLNNACTLQTAIHVLIVNYNM